MRFSLSSILSKQYIVKTTLKCIEQLLLQQYFLRGSDDLEICISVEISKKLAEFNQDLTQATLDLILQISYIRVVTHGYK